jgi:SAM-dependent methyltransferase
VRHRLLHAVVHRRSPSRTDACDQDTEAVADDVYRGLAVSTWDLWRDDTDAWPDRSLYLEVIRRSGEPVLDLLCASGRLLLDYLGRGIDIEGLDASAEMIALVREKAARAGLPMPTLHHQQLERIALQRRYRTILGASSALQLVTDAAAAARTMERVVQHLEPGGVFIGSFAFGWREGDRLDTGWELLFERHRPSDGATVRSWTREWHEPDQQVWHNEQRFEVELDGIVIEREHQRRSPEGRWYHQEQAVALLRSAGLEQVQLLSGFSTEPARPDDRLFCAMGVRP